MSVQPGAVVMSGGGQFVVWRDGACFPVRDQYEPLNRLDFVLEPGDCAWITGQRPLVRVSQVTKRHVSADEVVSHLSDAAMQRLNQQIARVRTTVASERQ